MPFYTFELRDGESRIEDDTGVRLPDIDHAMRYAEEVARELMNGRERQTRAWRLDVYESGHGLVFQLPFSRVDPTLEHLSPPLLRSVERLCESWRSLNEAVSAARVTVRESRALVAQSQGKPYLAAERGERTIRAIDQRG